MSSLSLTYSLVAGTPEDVAQVQQNFTDIRTWANGSIDADNFSSTNNGILGLNSTGVVRRGKSIIATEEARTNTAYGTLTTPDQVANVVLPTDGLICVAFQAMWKESVDAAARAAIFIGANQLKVASDIVAAPSVQEAVCPGSAGTYKALATTGRGLGGTSAGADATAYTGDVTTGQAVGVHSAISTVVYEFGPCYIFAAAGTYTISVQTKSTSGSVTMKERKLWVSTQGFS